MIGLVGHTGNEGNLLENMISKLNGNSGFKIDKYVDKSFSIGRTSKRINPETQPLFNEDRSLCIVMSGEVFGYEDIKKDLENKGHKFELEDNDAEFCLHLFEEFGVDKISELNGSFCMVIRDLKQDKIYLVSDRFATWPLFYYLDTGGKLYFGTKMASLLEVPDIPRKLNTLSLYEFFTFQRVLEDKTFYEDIKIVPAGEVLIYQKGEINFEKYWEFSYKETEYKSEAFYIQEMEKSMRKSMEIRFQKTKNPGLLLSGGLDSRLFPVYYDKPVVSFTYSDTENVESTIAQKIARMKNYDHTFLKLRPESYIEILDRVVDIGNGMYSLLHFPSLMFSDTIEKKCDVLFEFWLLDVPCRGSGLPKRKMKLFGKSISLPLASKEIYKNFFNTFMKDVKYTLYKSNPGQLFEREKASKYNEMIEKDVQDYFKKIEHIKNPYNKIDHFFMKYISKFPSFPNLSSVREYMDGRNIISDNYITDIYTNMPPEMRIKADVWKIALRNINKRMAEVPYTDTGMSPFTPRYLEWGVGFFQKISRKLTSSKKHGMDFATLIRENATMRGAIEETIRDEACLDPEIFNVERIKELFKLHVENKGNYAGFLMLLLTFGRWHKKYGPKA